MTCVPRLARNAASASWCCSARISGATSRSAAVSSSSWVDVTPGRSCTSCASARRMCLQAPAQLHEGKGESEKCCRWTLGMLCMVLCLKAYTHWLSCRDQAAVGSALFAHTLPCWLSFVSCASDFSCSPTHSGSCRSTCLQLFSARNASRPGICCCWPKAVTAAVRTLNSSASHGRMPCCMSCNKMQHNYTSSLKTVLQTSGGVGYMWGPHAMNASDLCSNTSESANRHPCWCPAHLQDPEYCLFVQ